MDNIREFYKNLLQIKDETNLSNTDNRFNLIGGILLGAGLIGSIFTKTPKYKEAKEITGIIEGQEEKVKSETLNFQKMSDDFTKTEISKQIQGLEARGIKDESVAKASQSQLQQGLTGAYAKAYFSLQKAKLNAKLSFDKAMIDYKMNLLEKQYKNELNKYKQSMSLYGLLGGVGTSLLQMGTKKTKKQENEEGKSVNMFDENKTDDTINSFEDMRG